MFRTYLSLVCQEKIMKKIYILFFIIPTCAFADSFTLTYYDNRFYDQTNGLGPGSVPAGNLTFISDIYYYFKPFEKQLQISQTEWLSDGSGNDYVAPYSPTTFDYHNISFDNITSEVLYLGEDYNFVYTVLPAWKLQFAEHIANTQIINTGKTVKMQNRQILNAVLNHQNIRTGRNGGDTKIPVYVWTQALYSHGNKRGNNAFSSDTLGTLVGGEIEASKKLNLGFGYGYSNTDYTADKEKTSMNNDSYFLYGKYKTKSLFINTIFAYNSGEYKY